MKRPNLFIVGAPRTGTTSLCAHLAGHFDIYMAKPKEPYFWCDDFPGLRKRTGCTELDRYLKLFNAANGQRYLAEGSTLYLASQSAVNHILEFNAEARFIVLLRNPIEIAISFFTHLRGTRIEDCPSFADAWRLQTARAAGGRLPDDCDEPHLLQYYEIVSLGSQLVRLRTIVPDNQLLLLQHQELSCDPARLYQRILNFLELPGDGRNTIDHLNRAVAYRNATAARFLHAPLIRQLADTTKRLLSPSLVNAARRLKQRLTVAPARKAPVDSEFLEQLHEELANETALLETQIRAHSAPRTHGSHSAGAISVR